MRNGFLLAFIGVFSLVLVSLIQSQAADSKKIIGPTIQYKKGEVVVKLKSQPKPLLAETAHTLLWDLAKTYTVTVRPLITDKSVVKVRVEDKVSVQKLIETLETNPVVQYAEPNFIYHTMDNTPSGAVVPNDPNFNLDWGLLNVGQKDSKGQEGIAGRDIGAVKAWQTTTGSRDLVVAVIDTGVDYNHEDLKDNIFINTKEDPSNGKDNDGNGFVNDYHGWNFEGKNNDPMDDNRHGTHVSGTIGAKGNNGIGTAGVNWNVRILPVKFLSASGSGTLEDAVEAIKYSTLMNANVMSNSWGGGGYSQNMFDAIKAARDKGILFVAAAGNEANDNDGTGTYPGSYQLENVIAVAATDNRDQLARWSSYGQRMVHLSAPGVNVYSTVPKDKGNYDTFSGTSMATPHVSGAAALLWSVNPKMTYKEIKDRLLATVDPVRFLRRKTISGGRLNVYNAINNIIPVRNEPPANRWMSKDTNIETKHPYDNNSKLQFSVSQPGAKYVRVHFKQVGVEKGYDFIRIFDSTGVLVEEITGDRTNYVSEYVDGEKLTIEFESDGSVNGYGFAVDSFEFVN